MSNLPHMKRREGDEYYCPRCAARWSIDEELSVPCIDVRGDDRLKRLVKQKHKLRAVK